MMPAFKILMTLVLVMTMAVPSVRAEEGSEAPAPAEEAAPAAKEQKPAAAPDVKEEAAAVTETESAQSEPAPQAAPKEKKEEKKEEKKQEAVKKEPAKKKPAPKKEAKKNTEQGNPVQEWIAAENKLIDTLSPRDQKSFFILRNKHGIIRSVRIVRRDISNAVKACGKENPDIRKTMNDRFKDWEGAVLPVIDLAEKFLKEEVEAQNIVFPSDFDHVMKLNDKAYEYGESKIEKQPVTTKDACISLLKSMDRTENRMVELLQDMLLPQSVIRDRAERAEAAEKEAASKKSAN